MFNILYFLASNLPYLIIKDEIMNSQRNLNMKTFKPYKQYFTSACLLGCFALFLTSCASRQEAKCGFVTNDSEHRLSHNYNLPMTLWLHPNVPNEYRHAFYTGADAWEGTFDGTDFFNIQELPETSSIVPRRDNRSIIYWDDQWNGSKDKETEQAKTTIYWMGSQIIDADIRFNAQDYGYYTDLDIPDNKNNTFVKNKNQRINEHASASSFNIINNIMTFIQSKFVKINIASHASNISSLHTKLRSIYINGVEQKNYIIHLESLIIHEFGHALGLDHNKDEESVMQERLSAQTERDKIGESDYKNISCEYDSVI